MDDFINSLKVSEEEKNKLLISRLGVRPNSQSSYGRSQLTVEQMKQVFDEQFILLIKKLNALIDSFAGCDEQSGELTEESLAALILTGIEDADGNIYTLKDLFGMILDGNLARYLSVSPACEMTLKGFYDYVRDTVLKEWKEVLARENVRVQSEKDRVSAENIRAESEEGRVSAENIRAESEKVRVTNEQGRMEAEDERNTTFNGMMNEFEKLGLINETKNLFNLTEIFTDSIYNSANQKIVAYAGYICTDFIALNTPFCVTYVGGGPTLLAAYFDKNKNQIASLLTADAELIDNEYYKITPPLGTEYVILNFRKSDYQQSVTMVTPWFYPDTYIGYGETYIRDTVFADVMLSTNDTTDVTANILAALTANKICRLGEGVFYVTNLDMPDDTTLVGVGAATHVILTGYDSDVGYAIKMGSGCTVKDLCVMGSTENISMSNTLLDRHGILWSGDFDTNGPDSEYIPKTSTIDNCFIKFFKGGGITCQNTGTPTNACLNVSNCFIQNCRAGINISYYSEYHRFTNIHVFGCQFGCINNGGNNVFVNCHFGSNVTGFYMDDTDDQAPNNSHGSAIGCTFNHCGGNNGIAVQFNGGDHGFIFSGCQIFYSKIILTNAYGIVFDGVNFGGGKDITIDGGGLVMFSGCVFATASTFSVSNNENVKVINCFTKTGDIVSL